MAVPRSGGADFGWGVANNAIYFQHTDSEAVITIKGSDLNGGYWGIGYYFVAVVNPQVTINPIQTPDENSSDRKMKWEVIRPAYPLPLDVNIDSLIEGSTASSEDAGYLPSVVEFRKVEVSPGVWQWEQSKIIETAVIDDADAEWTETYLAKVGEGEGYYADPTKKKAEIGDDDVKVELSNDLLIVNNDDSDEDGVTDLVDTDGVSDEDRLYEVDLKFPTAGRGGDITLNLSGSVKAWSSHDRTGELISGTENPPETIYIEAITGTSSLSETIVNLTVIDASATSSLDPTPRVQSDSDEGGAIGVEVTVNGSSSPNQQMLIGMGVSVTVSAIGPCEITKTNYSAGGSIFKDYVETEYSAYVVEVDSSEFSWTEEESTPNKMEFYWRSDSGEDTNLISASSQVRLLGATYGPGDVVGPILNQVATKVLRPTVNIIQDKVGVVGVAGLNFGNQQNPNPKWVMGLLPVNGAIDGVVNQVDVNIDNNLNLPAGEYYYTQLIDWVYQYRIPTGNANILQSGSYNGQSGLDTANPYPHGGGKASTDVQGQANPIMRDHPAFVENWQAPFLATYYEANMQFKDFLMFIPNGGKPVPLMVKTWGWNGKFNQQAPNPQPPQPPFQSDGSGIPWSEPFQNTNDHPIWNQVISKNNFRWV